jgi:hypothetical protein
MSTLHAQPPLKPVFSDASGRRVRVLTWLARGLCVCFVLVVGAVAFTMLTRVPLPGLGGLVPDGPSVPGSRTAPNHAGDAGSDAARLFPITTEATADRAQAVAPVVTHRVQPAPKGPADRGTTASAPAASGTTSTPATSSTPPAGSQGGTPSGNANAHATTKARNPQAAPKKPSPRVVKEPNENAATGRGRAGVTENSVPTPPGQLK